MNRCRLYSGDVACPGARWSQLARFTFMYSSTRRIMARCPPQLTSDEVARFGRDVDHILFDSWSITAYGEIT